MSSKGMTVLILSPHRLLDEPGKDGASVRVGTKSKPRWLTHRGSVQGFIWKSEARQAGTPPS